MFYGEIRQIPIDYRRDEPSEGSRRIFISINKKNIPFAA